MQKDSIILPIKAFIKKHPKLTRFLANYIDHFYEDHSAYKLFLQENKDKIYKLNLGSGAAPVENDFRNIDYFHLSGVSLRADVHKLPFKRNSIDAIQCMQLVEHVSEPARMIGEIHNALKAGGEIFVTAPFTYPYHEAPIDLNRWSLEGLRNLMKEFTPIRVGVFGGPTAALIEVFHCWLSILFSFNSDKLYQIIYLLLIPFLKPFKIIDRLILNRYNSSHRMASLVYFHGKK